MSTKRKPQKKRRSAREIRKQLRSIYEGADGAMPDMTKLDARGRSNATRILWRTIGLLAVLALLAWVGFFLFTQGLFQEDQTLRVTMDGPDEVKAGEEVTYTLRYENVSDVPVASLVAKLTVPSTFHVYSTVPESDAPLEWTIGSLSAGSDGAIRITGMFLAEVPSSQRLQTLLTYKPANFSSEFQDIVTKKIDVTDSILALSFTGPEKALAGDTSEYVINVQNTGTDPVYNLRVIPTLPTDFTITEANPELAEGQSYWSIDALDPGELAAITISGVYTSSAAGEQSVAAHVAFVDDDTVHTQAGEDLITDVLGGSISFSTIVNGSTQSQTADIGDSLRVSLDYANNGSESAEGLSITLRVFSNDGDVPIDWERANLSGGTRTGDEITWTDLDDLAPEDEHVIDLNLPLYRRIDPGEADQFSIETTLTMQRVGSVASTRTLEVTPIVIALNSDLQSSAQARYYADNGSAIGSGPMPPEVGSTTSYRIYWNMQNSLHALENVKFSTILPQDIAWLENTDTDIGSVSYNPTTREISWTTPKLVTDIESAGAWFELAINPNTTDIGRFMRLIPTTSVTATDTITGTSIAQSIGELTTELPDDTYAVGDGVIIE